MIKVNLLKNTGLEGAAISSQPGMHIVAVDQQKLAIGKVAVMLVFPGLVWVYESINISSLSQSLAAIQKQVTELDAEKQKYGDAAPKVEKFTKEKKRIDQHLDGIRELAKNRLREVKALDMLQTITPNQVWFDKILIDGSHVKATGYSNTDEGIETLYAQLSHSAMFSSFEPKSQSQETVNGQKVMRFDVEFRIGRSEAQR